MHLLIYLSILKQEFDTECVSLSTTETRPVIAHNLQSIIPEHAIENHDSTANISDKYFWNQITAPNGMLSAPCIHTNAGASVTVKGYLSSDKNSEKCIYSSVLHIHET